MPLYRPWSLLAIHYHLIIRRYVIGVTNCVVKQTAYTKTKITAEILLSSNAATRTNLCYLLFHVHAQFPLAVKRTPTGNVLCRVRK
jgi:hypothetical protein